MMDDLILYLYLIDVFGFLRNTLDVVLIGLTVVLVILTFSTVVDWVSGELDEIKPFLSKYGKLILIVFCVIGLIRATVPSTKTMYIALGLHTANQIMQQSQIAQVGNQAMRILQAKLDEYEKELTQENKGKSKK